ncbi:squalene epoxidase-domain-containing protein [Terfezia claveryi]|nr:squalene epoxidase-domain-containing protein [Terfezia claveryi]
MNGNGAALNGHTTSSSSINPRTYDIAIIGAGIIGTALAHTLGTQGRSILLLERDLSEPDRIVGELLQPGGVKMLTKLGLSGCLEGIDAIKVNGYEVIYHGKGVHIPYPPDPETGLQPQGRSFHHGRFVQKLRGAAARAQNVTVLEATVKDLLKDTSSGNVLGVTCRRKGEKEDEHFLASLTIAADGYASNFRKHLVKKKTEVTSTFVALELKDAVMPRPYHGHVLLGENAPILLYQISTHFTRALIDVRQKVPAGQMREHLQSRIKDVPEVLRPSFKEAIMARERYPSMPNSFLPATVNTVPGLLVVGDANNMRHPLTGGGMTVAFSDVVLLRDFLSPANLPDLDDHYEVANTLADFHWQRKGSKTNGSSTVNILSIALYTLFAADSYELKILQKACFRYFERGGECVDGPASLLATTQRNPWVLFWHFFAVAFCGIGGLFAGAGWRVDRWVAGVVQGVRVLWTACLVLFPYIFGEFRR